MVIASILHTKGGKNLDGPQLVYLNWPTAEGKGGKNELWAGQFFSGGIYYS